MAASVQPRILLEETQKPYGAPPVHICWPPVPRPFARSACSRLTMGSPPTVPSTCTFWSLCQFRYLSVLSNMVRACHTGPIRAWVLSKSNYLDRSLEPFSTSPFDPTPMTRSDASHRVSIHSLLCMNMQHCRLVPRKPARAGRFGR